MSSGIDYPLGETIHILFTTRAFSTGAPTQLAGTPVLSVYEDASTTQITSGVSLGVDHDTVTGLNLATVVATSGNGYEVGKSYHVVITTGTVDSVSVVGEVVGHFSIERSASVGDIATVDTVVDAIKVKTDQMTFTKANELDVNTLSINSAGVVGDGNATPWDGE